MTTVFQPKGKGHIKYINRMAHRLWSENYGCADVGWKPSIADALEIHREYLKTGIKMTKQELEYRKSNQKGKNSGIWWKNESTGKWEQLSRN